MLQAIGVTPQVFIDPAAPVTTPYDIMINQIVEETRGAGRHGSCGLGFGETIERWRALARSGDVDTLFESVMERHYDPCYDRSTRRNYGARVEDDTLVLAGLDPASLAAAVPRLVQRA